MPFTIAALTDEISDDFQEAVDIALEWGIQHIELHNVWGKNICGASDAEISRVLRIVRENGLTVVAIDSLTLRADLDDDEEYARHMEHLKRSIELTRLFDARMARLFSFWKRDDLDNEATWERIFEKMELPIRIAEAEGATLGFENVSSGNIGTSGEIERLLERFPSPALQLIWDPGNAYAAGDTRSALEGYEAVRERVVNVHIKDAAFVKGKRVWLPVGEGEVEYPPFLAALARDGYEGVLSLETHFRPPSGNRAEGSRAALDGLLAAIAEASALLAAK